jgi:hypothetical protein
LKAVRIQAHTGFSLTLLKQSRIAKLAPCCSPCVNSIHALAKKPFSQQLEVRLDFIAELAV